MVQSCGAKFVKYTLFILTFLFWLGGGTLLGIGIWLRVDKNILKLFKFIGGAANNTTDPVWDAAAYFIIAIGAVVFLISFCGCCGACTENRCLLITYAVLVAIMLCCEVAAAIVAGVYINKIDDATRQQLKTQVQQSYGGSTVAANITTDSWDYVQFTLKCCGADSPQDYKMNSHTEKNVPYSCCTPTNTDYTDPRPRNYQACNAEYISALPTNVELYNTGCYTQVKQWVTSHAAIIIGICAGIAALQLILVIFAACLAHRLLEEKMVYA